MGVKSPQAPDFARYSRVEFGSRWRHSLSGHFAFPPNRKARSPLHALRIANPVPARNEFPLLASFKDSLGESKPE